MYGRVCNVCGRDNATMYVCDVCMMYVRDHESMYVCDHACSMYVNMYRCEYDHVSMYRDHASMYVMTMHVVV